MVMWSNTPARRNNPEESRFKDGNIVKNANFLTRKFLVSCRPVTCNRPPGMRRPIIQQHDATDCGPAALAMVAAYHKKRVSIARLRESAGTDRHGTNLAGLKAAAEHVGFRAHAVRASREALGELSLP